MALKLVREESPMEFFKEQLERAMEHQKVCTSAFTEHYLVTLLAGCVRGDARFEPYDRFRHQARNAGRSLSSLLDEFTRLRAANLDLVRSWGLTAEQLEWTGQHPVFGPVTLAQLLAAWVVHDLGHLAQASRQERVRLLRAMGDNALFVSGFFASSLGRTLVDLGYYRAMGGQAYARLSREERGLGYAQGVFEELSGRFTEFADVLSEVSEASRLMSISPDITMA